MRKKEIKESILFDSVETPTDETETGIASYMIAGKTGPVVMKSGIAISTICEKEGGNKAFITENGKPLTVQSPSGIVYSTSSISGNSQYVTAAKYACSQMTKVSYKISVTTKPTYSASDKFSFSAMGASGLEEFKKDKSIIAINKYLFRNSDKKIVQSSIIMNNDYFKNYSLSQTKSLLMHELGHTFGLKDFYEDSLAYKNNATVMQGKYVKTYSDYTNFDKANLRNMYGY